MKKGFSWNKVVLIFYFASILYFFTGMFTGDPIKLWLGLIVGSFAYGYLLFLIYRRRRFRLVEADCKVLLHKEDVECVYENGLKYQMLWKDINRITVNRIEIKDSQQISEVWFRLHSYPWRQVFSVPYKADGFQDLYNKLTGLSGFDEEKVNQAIKTQQPVNLIVWQREL